jgi:hypothetical protein
MIDFYRNVRTASADSGAAFAFAGRPNKHSDNNIAAMAAGANLNQTDFVST